MREVDSRVAWTNSGRESVMRFQSHEIAGEVGGEGRRRHRRERRGVLLVALLLVGCTGAEQRPPSVEIQLPGSAVFETMQGALPLAFVMEQLPAGGLTPPEGAPESVVEHGYWVDRYLVEGSEVAVVWIHDPEEGGFPDGELRSQVTPLIFRDALMDGWGWAHFDQRREEWSVRDRSDPAEGLNSAWF